MIGSIKGTVAYQAAEYCLVETAGGVGYRVFMPVSQLRTLSVGQSVRVLTYTAVREDAIQLYGFMTQQYYDLFTLLLSVSGVGPKGALGILGAAKPEDFYLAVQSRDLKMLTKLPGIGKKTAERMVLELKDKIGTLESAENDREFAEAVNGNSDSAAVNEAMAALSALGYSNSEILPVLRKIPDYGTLKRDELIRKALQIFAKK
ncbi:MAG: Holliday junction branch migration protein RuvA [Acidaminococcaceae bacterium]|nr:Holliday junction branch migration protein RuvA [Acidaminococcaceae bacterium]MBO5605960.1 Holliday junction branch migration protein RuvA [Acidaminococcaceae bacterium]MBO6182064.1 Holliday junction branch migration protein RuvA [Acidaminococcaceae bacterium]MBO6264479.1 Holliday junction branch migration protein RuvA [Acidaminococcaceae bacterium]MBP3264513.1 Holliday junction branch migration protein RuvA [Acidaminococcaceae bacterium]